MEGLAGAPSAAQVVSSALAGGRSALTAPEVRVLCGAYGIPIPAEEMATSAGQAVAIACQLGYPVAVKVVSPDISHKSDAGGVVLDLRTPEEVEAAYAKVVAQTRSLVPDA
ncbi:MAG: acetate--CoA ligase family protein, partial [Candidatus Dormibacteria bacterium]